MGIQGVIFDVSDTLVVGQRGPAVTGVVEAVKKIRELGVKVIAVNNDGPKSTIEQLLLNRNIEFDLVVTRQQTGIAKGSPEWINYICASFNLTPNKLLYVGDSKPDMITASHGRVIFFHALWARPRENYGLAAPHPGYIAAIVEHIFLKQNNWWWQFRRDDRLGRPVNQLALINGDGAGDPQVKQDLISAFKDGIATKKVGQLTIQDFTLLHMLASLNATSLLADKTMWWATYPSSTPGKKSPMSGFLDIAAKLYREQYKEDLLVRAVPARHSRGARGNQSGPAEILAALANQLTTVHLNPAYREKIVGRKILVFDDFITYGPSSEAARNLLFAGNAGDVVTIAIGKYGPSMNVVTCQPFPDFTWNPLQPLSDLTGLSVSRDLCSNSVVNTALTEFLASYEGIKLASW
jgi:hypothetical protein